MLTMTLKDHMLLGDTIKCLKELCLTQSVIQDSGKYSVGVAHALNVFAAHMKGRVVDEYPSCEFVDLIYEGKVGAAEKARRSDLE